MHLPCVRHACVLLVVQVNQQKSKLGDLADQFLAFTQEQEATMGRVVSAHQTHVKTVPPFPSRTPLL